MTDYEHGIKKLTEENWLKPDGVWSYFEGISSGEKWIRIILHPVLAETVPLEVRKLFEVARSAMVYAYFFYPLNTLAEEQLYRVVEAGVTHKCEALGAPKSQKRFQQKVDWLTDQGIIPKHEKAWWDAVRDLRNMTSHPRRQFIIPPGGALGLITEKINSLFSTP